MIPTPWFNCLGSLPSGIIESLLGRGKTSRQTKNIGDAIGRSLFNLPPPQLPFPFYPFFLCFVHYIMLVIKTYILIRLWGGMGMYVYRDHV